MIPKISDIAISARGRKPPARTGGNAAADVVDEIGLERDRGRVLLQGELDLAVMAQPKPFNERIEVLPLYRERFCTAIPTGHRLEQQDRVEIANVAGETYLRRINCEYRHYLADQLRALGLAMRVGCVIAAVPVGK